jgi:RNA polymerase sigma-70 factor (ECF subfamily)
VAYARRHGLDPEEALDAVQDSFASFLKLPEARSISRSGDDSLKLLTVIVGNNVQNQRRKRGRHDRGMALASVAAIEGPRAPSSSSPGPSSSPA